MESIFPEIYNYSDIPAEVILAILNTKAVKQNPQLSDQCTKWLNTLKDRKVKLATGESIKPFEQMMVQLGI